MKTILLLAMLLSMPMVIAPVTATTKSYEIVEVATGVYAVLQTDPGIGNSAVIVTDVDVVVVDTGALPSTAVSIIDDIRALTNKPIRVVINTHWHDDHIWGNQAFRYASDNVEFIAHVTTKSDIQEQAIPALAGNIQRMKQKVSERETLIKGGRDADGNPIDAEKLKQMVQRVELFKTAIRDFESIEPTLPTRTIEESMVLDRGDHPIVIRHIGRGHARGDVVVHIPSKGVLITGDLVTHPIPTGSYPIDWIETLEILSSLEADVIIPGHGPVLRDTVYINQISGLLEAVVSQVRQAVKEGQTLDETNKAIDLGRWKQQFAGDDARLGMAFDMFFTKMAVERAYVTLTESQ